MLRQTQAPVFRHTVRHSELAPRNSNIQINSSNVTPVSALTQEKEELLRKIKLQKQRNKDLK